MSISNIEKVLGYNPNTFFYSKIYALCDFETLQKKDLSLDDFLSIIKKYDVKLIQYRDKISNFDIKKKNLIYLKNSTKIPIIINDDINLIEFVDGLHLGQEDLEEMKSSKFKVKNKDLVFKLLKKKYPNKLFGLSTHNEKEVLEANSFDLDMIGLGAYRNTNTKNVNEIIGDKISYLAKISKHPVCAIGGVRLDDDIKDISFKVISSGLYD